MLYCNNKKLNNNITFCIFNVILFSQAKTTYILNTPTSLNTNNLYAHIVHNSLHIMKYFLFLVCFLICISNNLRQLQIATKFQKF
jgi:hypothetical protein